MIRLELSENEALLLREILEARAHDILREIHHAHHREFRDLLKEREVLLEKVLDRLPQGELAAR